MTPMRPHVAKVGFLLALSPTLVPRAALAKSGLEDHLLKNGLCLIHVKAAQGQSPPAQEARRE